MYIPASTLIQPELPQLIHKSQVRLVCHGVMLRTRYKMESEWCIFKDIYLEYCTGIQYIHSQCMFCHKDALSEVAICMSTILMLHENVLILIYVYVYRYDMKMSSALISLPIWLVYYS